MHSLKLSWNVVFAFFTTFKVVVNIDNSDVCAITASSRCIASLFSFLVTLGNLHRSARTIPRLGLHHRIVSLICSLQFSLPSTSASLPT
jgi:hypothetical protein